MDVNSPTLDDKKALQPEVSPEDHALAFDGQHQIHSNVQEGTAYRITRISSIITVLIAGLALFSDGYNAQIIGYMNPLFTQLYPDVFTKTVKTRLSNAYLIGEIFGMLFFGYVIDTFGRRTGIFFATVFLVFGLILATAAHGTSPLGMFWMMIVGRGVAGFGAGGIYISQVNTTY
jgi:MFS family permease